MFCLSLSWPEFWGWTALLPSALTGRNAASALPHLEHLSLCNGYFHCYHMLQRHEHQFHICSTLRQQRVCAFTLSRLDLTSAVLQEKVLLFWVTLVASPLPEGSACLIHVWAWWTPWASMPLDGNPAPSVGGTCCLHWLTISRMQCRKHRLDCSNRCCGHVTICS